MELVEGGTLFAYLLGPDAGRRAPLGVAGARRLFQQLVLALDFMHRWARRSTGT